MPQYMYTAMDSKGKEQKGKIVADSEAAAVAELKQKGMFPTSVKAVIATKKKKASFLLRILQGAIVGGGGIVPGISGGVFHGGNVHFTNKAVLNQLGKLIQFALFRRIRIAVPEKQTAGCRAGDGGHHNIA